MIAPTRSKTFDMPLARMKGHREGYRAMNGESSGMNPLVRDFRYRMHELCGEARRIAESGLAEERSAGLGELWRHIYGLHEFFGKSPLVDDLIGLLIMARKEWKGLALEQEKVELLRDCLNAMGSQEPAEAVRLEWSRKLRRAGVDMNSEF
jgi:hypothetical protein